MKGNRKSLIRDLLQIREERKKAFLLHLLISRPRGAVSNSFGAHRGYRQIALGQKLGSQMNSTTPSKNVSKSKQSIQASRKKTDNS